MVAFGYDFQNNRNIISNGKMNLYNYISLMRFEVLALGVIVLLLMVKILLQRVSVSFVLRVANFSLLAGIICGFMGSPKGSVFGGMFVNDGTLMLEKIIITFATLLVSLQASNWLKNHSNYLDFYLLLFTALLGMYFLVSSGNFLMFFLSLEMATIPLAALASFDFGRIRSAEGAGKMILSSAFSSAIMLFGLSLLYGITGSLDFCEVSEMVSGTPLEIFAFTMLFAGFGFKISAVPFHLWTADVYEGAPVPITAFLSVVSKSASVFILITVLSKVFANTYKNWVDILMLVSAVTMTVGNLFAMRQVNIKRFLAFSSITQAGYILIGVTAATCHGTASTLYFIFIYVFSNICAFTVVSLISEKTDREDISDYKGLYNTNPLLSIAMLLALFSLAGIPPTAGFFGKLFLLSSGASAGMIPLVIVAALNMILSLYYYLRVVKAMFVDKSENPVEFFRSDSVSKIVLVVCTLGIILTGFFNYIFEYIYSFSFGL